MHPLKRMLEAGLMATCNSDDPAYFGGYIGDNLKRCEEVLRLTSSELLALAKNSFNASFISDAAKQSLIAEIDDFAAQAQTQTPAPN
jgi:adenosine deaminase